MGKYLTIFFLFLSVLFTLTGCFVNDKDSSVIQLPAGDISYPIYKHGDRLEYNVFGTMIKDGISSNTSGSLSITWQSYGLLNNPLLENPIPYENVLREETTLEVIGLGKITTVRYITQFPGRCISSVGAPPINPIPDDQNCSDNDSGLMLNPNYGSNSVFLIAVENIEGKKYWVTTDSQNPSSPTVSLIAGNIYPSPVPQDSNPFSEEYYLLTGCNFQDRSCKERAATIKYGTIFAEQNLQGRQTALGTFQVLRTNLTHSVEPQLNSDEYVSPSIIDFRAACSTTNSSITSNTSTTGTDGTHEVHPSVGNVYMFMSCSAVDSSFSLHFEIDNYGGSITIP